MKIEVRTDNVKSVRKLNKVPGVLYGKSITPVSIQVDEKELNETFRANGKTQTFTIKLGKESHEVYIKDIQKDVLKLNHYLNVDLLKVDKGDTITAKVPLHIIGKEIIQEHGFIVQVIGDTIEVEYPAGQRISQIEVDISNMHVRDLLHVSDVKFPEGVIVIDDAEKVLIHIAEMRTLEVEPEEDEEEEEEEAEVAEEPKPKAKEERK